MSGDVHLTVGLVLQAFAVAVVIASPYLMCMLAVPRLHRIRHEHAKMMGKRPRPVAGRPQPVKRLRKLASQLRGFVATARRNLGRTTRSGGVGHKPVGSRRA